MHKLTPEQTKNAPSQTDQLEISSPRKYPEIVVTRNDKLLVRGTASDKSMKPRQ